MLEETALVKVERLNLDLVFSGEGVTAVLGEIREKALSLVPDTTTDKGRKEIASMAYKVARSKTLLDDLGKSRVAVLKEKIKVNDAARKEIRDTLDALKGEVRKPLTEWEAEDAKRKAEEAEAERVKVQERVDHLAKYGRLEAFHVVFKLSDEEYGVLLAGAQREWRAEQDRLEAERKAKEEEEKRLAEERAELERMRSEQQERDRKAREEAEKVRKEQEEREAVLRAEQKKIEDEKRRLAEQVRREQERKDREKFEAKAREEAEARAEKEAAEKAERERLAAIAKEKADAEEKARHEALRPDKERVIEWANSLLDIVGPEINNNYLSEIVTGAIGEIYGIAQDVLQETNSL